MKDDSEFVKFTVGFQLGFVMLCLKYVHVGEVFDRYEEFEPVFVHSVNALGVGNHICIE